MASGGPFCQLQNRTLDAVKDVATAAQEAAKQATDKADAIIKQAQSLIGAGDFEDALAALNNLIGLKLTAAQQKLVAALKAEIQKALAGKTADSTKSAVGNLLGKQSDSQTPPARPATRRFFAAIAAISIGCGT